MKNKTLIIISGVMLLTVVLLVIYFTLFKNNKSIEEDNEECLQLTGGSFTLKINKNNNEKTEEISICIACSPDSYEKIEDPTYEGYTFLGWYYDSKFKEKAEFETTLDIEPIEEKNIKGCVTGYKTREIFAKWEKEPEKTAKCPDGYTLSNDTCKMTTTVDANPVYTCSEGSLEGSKCAFYDNTIYNCSTSDSNYYHIVSAEVINSQCVISYKKINTSNDLIMIGEFDFENNQCGNVVQGTCEVVDAKDYKNVCNDGYTYSNGTCRKETNASISKYTCNEGTLNGSKCTIVKTTTPTYE